MPNRRLRDRPTAAPTAHLVFPSCFDFEDEVRDRFLADLAKASAEGDVVIVHPESRSKGGRERLSKRLRLAGVAPEIVRALGWDTVRPLPPADEVAPVRPQPRLRSRSTVTADA